MMDQASGTLWAMKHRRNMKKIEEITKAWAKYDGYDGEWPNNIQQQFNLVHFR